MKHPELAAGRVRSWGVQIIDLPSGACGRMCRRLSPVPRAAPPADRETVASLVPLPDFLIGAHAQLAGWPLATGDPDRIRTYFPRASFS